MRGVRAFWMAHAVPSVGRTPHVGMALDASRHPLHGGEAHSFVPCMVELQQRVFLPSFFLSLSSALKNMLFVIFITFGHPSFNCIKLQLFIFSIASFVI